MITPISLLRIMIEHGHEVDEHIDDSHVDGIGAIRTWSKFEVDFDGNNDVNIVLDQVLGVVQRDLQERTFQQVNDIIAKYAKSLQFLYLWILGRVRELLNHQHSCPHPHNSLIS